MLCAGRYADEFSAAKAYDKAAVYLYSRSAITNFGLEACKADCTTEVGPCCECSRAGFVLALLGQQTARQRTGVGVHVDKRWFAVTYQCFCGTPAYWAQC
jgi:hypothetical protein